MADQGLPPSTDALGSAVPETGAGRSVLVRGGSWNAAAQLAPLLVNLTLTPFVIHGLGIERFGLYVLATSIADFLGTFDGGLYAASQRYFAVYAGARDRRSTSRLCLSLVAGVAVLGAAMWAVLAVVAPLLVAAFRVPVEFRAEGAFLLRVLGIVIALELIRGVFAAILNAYQRFALSSLTTVLQYGIYAVGIVLTVQHGWGLRGVGLTLLVQTAVTMLVLAAAAARHLSARQLRVLPRRELFEFLHYAGRAQVAGLSDLINLQSDSLIVGGFLGVGNVTLYSSGRNFATQLRALPWNGIAPAAALLGATLGRDGGGAVLAQFGQLQRIWVRACSGWIAVAAAAAWFGVTKWLGADFHVAGVVAVVLLVGYLFRLWAGMLTVYCQTVGRPDLEARYGVFSVVVNLVLTLAFVVPFGVVGVVAATAAGQLLGSLYLLRISRAGLGGTVPSFFDDVPWRTTVLVAAVTVVLEAVAYPALTTGPLGLLEAGAVAAVPLLLFAVLTAGPSVVRRRLTSWRPVRTRRA